MCVLHGLHIHSSPHSLDEKTESGRWQGLAKEIELAGVKARTVAQFCCLLLLSPTPLLLQSNVPHTLLKYLIIHNKLF